MRLPGTGRLRKAGRGIRRKFVKPALILLYHRVAELRLDSQLLAVTPAHFAEQLDILKRRARPVSLDELTKRLGSGELPERAVAVTFDDGYADNLQNAKPLLESQGVPATVFVTTGYVEGQREFWWDELEGLLLEAPSNGQKLELTIDGVVRRWSENDFQRAYHEIFAAMRAMPDSERGNILEQLRSWAGRGAACRPSHRPLSSDEVRELPRSDVVEVGAHSRTHPVLSGLPVPAQREEVEGSKADLERILGRPVTSFAYPYGTEADYSAETVRIVRSAGFGSACVNVADVVWRGTDRFEIPRLLVRNWDATTFERQLEEWFDGRM